MHAARVGTASWGRFGTQRRRIVTVVNRDSQNQGPHAKYRTFGRIKSHRRELRAIQRWPTSAILEKTPYCYFLEHGGAHGGFMAGFSFKTQPPTRRNSSYAVAVDRPSCMKPRHGEICHWPRPWWFDRRLFERASCSSRSKHNSIIGDILLFTARKLNSESTRECSRRAPTVLRA